MIEPIENLFYDQKKSENEALQDIFKDLAKSYQETDNKMQSLILNRKENFEKIKGKITVFLNLLEKTKELELKKNNLI